MKTHWGLIVTIALGIIAIVLTIYLIRKSEKDKQDSTFIPPGGSPAPGGGPVYTPPAPNPEIGKVAYAKIDGVKVYNSNYSLYKTASKDEWIGTVQGTKDGLFYVVSAGRLVGMGSVYLT